ncbi:hypothetical protein QBC45DRAFT_397966 [Copromyces sp. CBS 386.78]|nr:hypothetical protein QBC45DRAFT_397966 [Copromyces sp. CBS 386.78]
MLWTNSRPLLSFLLLLLAPSFSLAAAPTSPPISYTNTLIERRADPHISKHTESEASWTRKEGLADAAKGVSFEAVGVTGQYLTLTGTNGGLVLAGVGGDQGQRGQATFYLE